MHVKCVICDKIEDINDDCLQAKRLRNRRLHMYLCAPCKGRIAEKTKKRHATGNFRLYKENKQKKDLI
ncbi:YlaI family protein [Virgibacillus sp. W0181]|uniref:YlaI family protein n=1 Tax=Virgibacillus sp. W0181 TaxID=3391581 RepID=UPI003F48D45B